MLSRSARGPIGRLGLAVTVIGMAAPVALANPYGPKPPASTSAPKTSPSMPRMTPMMTVPKQMRDDKESGDSKDSENDSSSDSDSGSEFDTGIIGDDGPYSADDAVNFAKDQPGVLSAKLVGEGDGVAIVQVETSDGTFFYTVDTSGGRYSEVTSIDSVPPRLLDKPLPGGDVTPRDIIDFGNNQPGVKKTDIVGIGDGVALVEVKTDTGVWSYAVDTRTGAYAEVSAPAPRITGKPTPTSTQPRVAPRSLLNPRKPMTRDFTANSPNADKDPMEGIKPGHQIPSDAKILETVPGPDGMIIKFRTADGKVYESLPTSPPGSVLVRRVNSGGRAPMADIPKNTGWTPTAKTGDARPGASPFSSASSPTTAPLAGAGLGNAPSKASTKSSAMQDLRMLKSQYERGILSKDDYEAAKSRVLRSIR